MDNQRNKVGETVLVGRMGYQIYSRVWNGRIQFSARVGKPYIKKETGEPGIITELESYFADDFLKAANQAREQLDHLSQAVFREQVKEQQSVVAKVMQKGNDQKSQSDNHNHNRSEFISDKAS